MKYIVSVSKTYIHRGNHRHRDSTKKHWHIYYYDEEGKIVPKEIKFDELSEISDSITDSMQDLDKIHELIKEDRKKS